MALAQARLTELSQRNANAPAVTSPEARLNNSVSEKKLEETTDALQALNPLNAPMQGPCDPMSVAPMH